MRSIFVLIAVLGTTSAHADTPAQNFDKYRHLRERLRSEFVSVGPAQGQSQPAPERMDNIGLMKWGDGTIALGFYLGVLATEHYMRSNPGLFPDADAAQIGDTRDELYHALLALERLDSSADAAFPTPCGTSPALNGFFLRDDVPENFHTKFPGISVIQSDFIDPTLTNKEESQDQVYHVQHGLALVVALVPQNVSVNGRPLREWAIQQATRIVQHFAKGDWIIRNPACSNRTVNRGENATGYSYGETLAARVATGGAIAPTTAGFWQTIWDTLRNPSNPAYNDEDNLHMSLAIMAVGDGYGGETAQVLLTLAETQDWYLYPLMHRVLHPTNDGFCATAPTINPRVRTHLDELPANGDPGCPGAAGPAPHGFTTHNRYIRGKSQAYVGPQGCEGIRYHGLDFMLLHNLYAIATPGTWHDNNPNADPCVPIVQPDGPPMGADAGIEPGGDAGVEPTQPPAGCGCGAGADASWPLFLLAFAWVLRRQRRVTSSAASL